ncbi:MAG: tetratricopeptide repeat protein [Rhodospirillaceae bacterium]|nr:tetratricopeptide repeat protein [Rhodospirillaceae bacterium]
MTSDADHYVTRAVSALRSGDAKIAQTELGHAVAANPNHAEALHLLGVLAFQDGDAAKAITLIQRAIASRPDFADAYSNLGSVLMATGQNESAEAALRRAVALNNQSAAIHFNLANVLSAQQKYNEALASYQAAVQIQPTYPEAWNNLGAAYRELENLAIAVTCFEKAVAGRPSYAEAQYNLANAYRDQMRLSAAEDHMRKAIALNPGNAKAHNALGNILSDSAQSELALTAFEQAEKLDPASVPISSNVLSCLQYVPGITDARLAAAHAHWVGAHNDLFTAPHHRITNRDPSRPLNVGFVSSDLGHHPCGFLSVRLFEHLDRKAVNAVVFSNRNPAREDHISRRIADVTDWRRVADVTDANLAADIAATQIDILIDMNGHTAGHRLGVFARKPAPIQMTWLGYVGSTGLPTMDYIIADRWHAPENAPITGPENVLRLRDGYTCYDPLVSNGDVTPLPALSNGFITFGSLNNANKLSPTVIKTYAAIMARIPNSRMILAFRGLDDPAVNTRLLSWFAGHGIDATRIDIHGYAPHEKFLSHYNRIDLALDTFPYAGGLTTCEALWMGVPVVTFPGATFAGRHAASYMNNAGLSDFVAADQNGFEDLAVAKAQDVGALSALRQNMHARLNASPLMDGTRFAESFTLAMREAWQTYCVSKA